MKRHVQNSLIAFVSLVALLACGLPTPGNDNTATATPSDQPATQQLAPTPTTPTFELPTGRLLVASGPDNRSYQWHIVNLPEQTVEDFPVLGSDASTYVNQVSVSPDFAHLSFQRSIRTDYHEPATLYVMDTATSALTEVASNADHSVYSEYLNWSLDGQWLSYAPGGFTGVRPFAYNLPTGNLNELPFDMVGTLNSPAPSPNGDRLVLICNYCTESGLYMIDTDGSNLRFLLKGAYSFIVWHPDGTRLYLIEDPGHIYSFDLATGTKTEVPGAAYLFSWLKLSPNGKLISYIDSKRGLSFINTEDDSILPVSFSNALGGHWSPDSRYICNFADERGRYTDLLDVQTGLRAQIDLGAPDSECHGWLP